VLEKSAHFLAKVRISGGGRCNVTHHCFEPRQLAARYPRGGQALLGPLHQFGPRQTIDWFERRGVTLKTEADGRMFPVTDSSETIVSCLMGAAGAAKVRLRSNCEVRTVQRRNDGTFLLDTGNEILECDRLMLATGGCRTSSQGALAVGLGHTLEPPVPSLFTFQTVEQWPGELSGVTLPEVELTVPETNLKASGPLLFTHAGLSGPAVLRLSAWGARWIHAQNYQFTVRINWLAGRSETELVTHLEERRKAQPSRYLANAPVPWLPTRLWERLVLSAGVAPSTRLAEVSRTDRHQLLERLRGTELRIKGKTLNQDEFVTCGGVRLDEVQFKTMESKLCPGLYFGGELLDIDALTGGFNFQAAWTTGYLAGRAMAG
jgi:predicted Rossmann fold flavoprotein